MAAATFRIRRQLARDPDVVRWASVVAGPREFWTITAWRSRHPMLEFMRSGAHEEIMWLFSKWLESFWLMRWTPLPCERGAWDDLRFAPPPSEPNRAVPGERQALLDRALDHLPHLRAATGPDGAARFDATPAVRRRREDVAGSRAVVTRLHTSIRDAPAAATAIRNARKDVRRSPHLVRSSLGMGRPGDLYLLTVWNDVDAAEAAAGGSKIGEIHDRWGAAAWTNVWSPENEFGNWDGLRLRHNRERYAIAMPREAMALDRHAEVSGGGEAGGQAR